MATFTTNEWDGFLFASCFSFFNIRTVLLDPWDTSNCTLQILHPPQQPVDSLKKTPRTIRVTAPLGFHLYPFLSKPSTSEACD